MKKLYIIGTLAAVALTMASCDDFINDNRYPLSQQVVDGQFWNNTVNVENQCNYFYEIFSGYGNGSSYGNFYFNTASDDQAGTVGGEFRDWQVITVPSSAASWSTPYALIRRACLIVDNVEPEGNSIGQSQKDNFLGIARMARAYEYYLLVRAYGDVPLVKNALNVEDTEVIYGPRTSRNEVMDFALADIDYAVAHIGNDASSTTFSKDLARAIKAEICLFEASYQRYVAKDEARAAKFYNEVVSATESLITKYAPGANYRAIYTSLNGALASNPEMILCKTYQQGVFMHSTVDYTSGSTPIAGITKDAFDAFLFTDGKPLASTTLDKSDAGVMEDGKLSIENVLSVRDQRLAATTYPYVFYEDFPYQGENTAPMTSTTGYGVMKYNNFAISLADATTANKNYTDAPIYWGAEMCLAYAEAKAELGTLNDGDLNKTLNPLYTRAGLPTQTVASLTAMNDPANNMDVSSLIWEVRRCRRCELMMDNDIRYWDLIRWNQLEKMDTQKYPNVARGANLANATVAFETADGYMNPVSQLFGGKQRVYNSKYNLYPIPSGQIQLNSKLTQNPGW